MDAESRQTILKRCEESRRCNRQIRSLIPSDRAPSLRANFARCAIDLALELHSALIRIAEAGEYGAAGTLLRPILEASTAGFWFVYVASCSEIQALPTVPADNPKQDIPDLKIMLGSLTPTFPDIKKLSHGMSKGGTAKWLHKYTHGSVPQLTRRAQGGWTEREIVATLIRGDMFAVLAACLETVIAVNAPLETYGFNRRDELAFEFQTTFVTDPIPYAPRGLPPAPLLKSGCGPPFA